MISKEFYKIHTFVVLVLCAKAYVNGANITIPLNKGITWVNKELYSDFININRSSTIQVNFLDINKNVSFIIFQVHSHMYNVTVYNNSCVRGSCVSGTNIGLYSSVKTNQDTFFIFNQNENVDLKLFVSVLGYKDTDPIPGGCNMEFPIPISPFMNTILKKDYIYVDAPPARYYRDPDCISGSNVNTEFYMMYLPTGDYDADTYFGAIKKMMTFDNIRENGDRIPKSIWSMRRMLSLYPGTGVIFVVVASNNDSNDEYSVYVPTHSYGCQLTEGDMCEVIDNNLSRLVCASLLFVGLFVCYFGHRFFKTEMFLIGMLSGVVITFIVISLLVELDSFDLLAASIISGIFFGASWLTFWWFYGIPVIAVSLPALNMGFLMSAIIYNKFPGDLLILQDDFNFWTLFVLIMLLASMILVSVAFVSNILCCAVLGSYAIVYPIDFYLGSNIKYLIINTIRRATVPKFNRAVLMPPFGWRDALVIVLWTGLAISGFLFQHYHNRGRPPFPPPPRSVRPGRPEPMGYYGAVPATSRNVIPTIRVSGPVVLRTDERTPLMA
ncbi:hypothetical protein ABMA28_003359 [Loxostege sticticalis]|uniref:TM7S3/TM198-like domain-containing protein n=1 Tax=Loxostege sticticalis TaxID=481309 RepID=A0ABD0SVU3_LOXSC